ncbi:MAG: thioredoxin family protein [Candidatus Melainabacteria bacterium]|mgnify:CR=1 FL=1|nr:thioredoxin family protein [Candidatus Melainabacteria bacterium]
MKSLIKFAMLFALAVGLAFIPAVSNSQTLAPQAEKKVEVKQLDDATAVDTEMKNAKTLVLVDFTAAWCGPCQMLKPKIEALAQEFKGKVVFTKIEHTVAPGLITQYGIRAFPTVKMFEPGGKEVSQVVGNLSLIDLRKWIQGEVDKFDAAQKAAQPKPQKP